jgi:serine/threonine protein kinase
VSRFTGLLIGKRFRLGPRVASGGQGRTYLALEEKTEKVVVVKEHKLGEAGWKKFELFEREARVLKQLRHPGIPRVIDRFEGEKGTYYLVMEKAPGATLKAIATRARFTETELRDIMKQVLEILEYMHGLRPPVIHRDIKPANLLRDASGKISLVDFGGVREALREEGGTTVVGTFGYMAPEQLHGAATAVTDLYGLAATIVSLAGGVEPEQVPRRGLRMDLKRHLAGLPAELIQLLERMTDPDPDMRPGSAREALELMAGRKKTPKAMIVPVVKAQPLPIAPADIDDEDPTLPWPIRMIMRIAFVIVGTAGFVTLTAFELALVPLFFALLTVFAKDETKPRLNGVKTSLQGALHEGRRGFRDMQKRGLTGRKAPPALPPPRR